MTAPETKRRSDYESNRELILTAADRMFKELGPDTPIQQIANAAGVGIATVYRHFPNRDELVRAAFGLRLEEHRNAILESQQEPDELTAFRETVQRLTLLNGSDRAFNAFIAEIDGVPMKFPGFQAYGTALLDAMTRAERADVWREGIGYTDILLMLVALQQIAPELLAESDAALRRHVDIALDGVCERRLAPSGKPIDGAGLDNVFRHGQA